MITSRTVSSLEKIFHDSEPTCASLSEMSMLGNERASFQLAYFPMRRRIAGYPYPAGTPKT